MTLLIARNRLALCAVVNVVAVHSAAPSRRLACCVALCWPLRSVRQVMGFCQPDYLRSVSRGCAVGAVAGFDLRKRQLNRDIPEARETTPAVGPDSERCGEGEVHRCAAPL